MSKLLPENSEERPDIADLEGENYWTQLARKYWSKTTVIGTVKAEVIKTEIWDVLEDENFQFRSLLILENLRLVEKFVPLPFFALSAKELKLSMAGILRIVYQLPCPPNCSYYNCQGSRKSSSLG